MGNQAPMRFARRKADLESLWLMTFSDLMVQLMAFFALLYSFSVADQTKLQQAVTSIQKALGVDSKAAVTWSGDGILPGTTGMDPAKAEDLLNLLLGLVQHRPQQVRTWRSSSMPRRPATAGTRGRACAS